MKEILIVDDEEHIIELAKEYLPTKGYGIKTAKNGQEAVDYVIKYNDIHKKFDLILMDLNMPIMNGYQANKRILNIVPDQKILICTGEDSHSYLVEKCKNLGLNKILKKPYTLTRLNNYIDAMINPLGDRL